MSTASVGSITTQGEYTMTNNLYLFSQNYNGAPRFSGVIRVSYFKYYDKNDELICNLVPCYRKSDSVIGMYDLVRGIFLTNAGAGTFTKGADVNLADKVNMSYNLTNATLSNMPVKINSAAPYTATISTTNGHQPIVTVLMNGVDVTNEVYDGDVTINIASITGDIVITIDETVVNLLPLATDTDRTTIYNGTGYYNGKRWSSSGGKITTGNTTTSMTGFFTCKPGDILRVYNYTKKSGTKWYMVTFDESQSVVKCVEASGVSPSGAYVSPGYAEVTLGSATYGEFTAIRLSWGQFNAESIVTINQVIPQWESA
jgi:hypothetical protein